MYIHGWGPYEKDITRVARRLKRAVHNAQSTLWGLRNIGGDCTIPISNDSILISLINKLHHDRHFCKRWNDDLDYYYFIGGNWINNLLLRNGYLTQCESEIVWSNPKDLPSYIIEEKDEIQRDFLCNQRGE